MTDTDPYVPDLEHIKSAYVDGRRDDTVLSQEAEAEFDRWMKTHAVVDLTKVDVENIIKVARDYWGFHPRAKGVNPVEVGVRETLRRLGLVAS